MNKFFFGSVSVRQRMVFVARSFFVLFISSLLIACSGGGGSSGSSDTVAPVVTLNGYATLSVAINVDYSTIDPGATAADAVDGSVTVIVSGINTSVAGVYQVTYSATDSAGNTGTAIRTVTVIDTASPVISLNGSSTARIGLNGTYTELGSIVSDSDDTGLTAVITGSVNTAVLGTYILTYTATDSDSNVTTVTRTVIVVPLLNDTGLTWGGNYPSGNNASCIGETVGEQDCSSGRDAVAPVKVGAGVAGFDFTKLDSSGNALAAAAVSWSCVKDNHTGLIWEAKTTDAQGTNLHSKSDSFNWYSTDTAINGGLDEGSANNNGAICTGYNVSDPTTFCNTEAFIARVNASNVGAGLCGATGWRLPTIKELKSITNLAQINPAIDDSYFPNTGSEVYWSNTAFVNISTKSWGINFATGKAADYYRSDNYPARLVRTAP